MCNKPTHSVEANRKLGVNNRKGSVKYLVLSKASGISGIATPQHTNVQLIQMSLKGSTTTTSVMQKLYRVGLLFESAPQ